MRSSLAVLVTTISLVAGGLLVTGCQGTSGFSFRKAITSESSPHCTKCRMQTKQLGRGGTRVTQYTCPDCRKKVEYTADGKTVIHVCDNCGTAMEQCPICRRRTHR